MLLLVTFSSLCLATPTHRQRRARCTPVHNPGAPLRDTVSPASVQQEVQHLPSSSAARADEDGGFVSATFFLLISDHAALPCAVLIGSTDLDTASSEAVDVH